MNNEKILKSVFFYMALFIPGFLLALLGAVSTAQQKSMHTPDAIGSSLLTFALLVIAKFLIQSTILWNIANPNQNKTRIFFAATIMALGTIFVIAKGTLFIDIFITTITDQFIWPAALIFNLIFDLLIAYFIMGISDQQIIWIIFGTFLSFLTPMFQITLAGKIAQAFYKGPRIGFSFKGITSYDKNQKNAKS